MKMTFDHAVWEAIAALLEYANTFGPQPIAGDQITARNLRKVAARLMKRMAKKERGTLAPTFPAPAV